MQTVIGVDIGGTKIAAHICDTTFQTLHELSVTCPAREGGEAVLRAVINLCNDLLQSVPDAQLLAVGVGSAGQIDPVKGMVVDANPNIMGWTGVPIADRLGAELGCPILVENDVRAMAMAEFTLGAGKPYQHVLAVTVGTGIGGALILNGKLWHGAHYSAGEVGFLRAEEGLTIENTSAGAGLERTYMQRAKLDQRISLREITQRAHAGEALARQVIVEDGAKKLGDTLAPLLAIIDPEAVIVGGGVPHIGDLWWQPFLEAIQQFSLKSVRETPVIPAQLGNRAGMIGAAILAYQRIQTM